MKEVTTTTKDHNVQQYKSKRLQDHINLRNKLFAVSLVHP